MTEEKTVSYTSRNTYTTLNKFTENTKTIWIVCHGLGYLSSYFINYFDQLDPEENYIAAPQAPSKYYQDKKFKYVGASWFTKQNTEIEIRNVLNYMDAFYDTEIKPKRKDSIRLIVFGFSQGVSVACRWVAHSKIDADLLVLHSGGIPKELSASQFDHLSPDTRVLEVYGTRDEYLSSGKIIDELTFADELFRKKLEIFSFEGVHEVNKELITSL